MSSWGRLRKELRSRVVADLVGRIDIHYTAYEFMAFPHHKDANNMRVWLTLDKKEIFSSDFWDIRKLPIINEIEKRERRWVFYPEAEELGARCVNHYMLALKTYLNSPIEEARTAELPLIRALFWVDRRVGRRTLLKHKPAEDEHKLVKQFYELRQSSMRSQQMKVGQTDS